MSDNHLIVFVKQPIGGKVKTRIAHSKGNEIALEVYINLLENETDNRRKSKLPYTLFVEGEFFFINWTFNTIHKQQGSNLGERMRFAFETVFNLFPNSNCIIIGSDCYELTSSMIDEAFVKLDKNNFVIGPANDGGYYLLGMKILLPALFQNINWSTNKVYDQTIAKVDHAATLPALNDIDLWEDVLNNPSLLQKIK
nr:TIGR04282 family arsenosugar biosynthesis glycosyltransferase [Bacteroidota bacterium]